MDVAKWVDSYKANIEQMADVSLKIQGIHVVRTRSSSSSSAGTRHADLHHRALLRFVVVTAVNASRPQAGLPGAAVQEAILW